MALALFLADTVLYFMEYRSGSQSAGDQGFVQHDESAIHQQDYNKPDIEQIP